MRMREHIFREKLITGQQQYRSMYPIDADLKWDEVKLWVSGKMIGGRIPYHNATSYDPNASLGGQMEKY